MNIKSFISQLSSTAKITSAIIGGVISVVTLTGIVYGAGMKKANKENHSLQVENKVDNLAKEFRKFNISDSIRHEGLTDTLAYLSTSIRKVAEKQEEAKEAYNSLRNVVLDHVSKDKSMTIEQFKNYIESAPELKKNFSPIVLK